MEAVDKKERVLEELRLSRHAVGRKSTCKVINDDLRCNLPVTVKGGENVVATFSLRDHMESETNHVRTPCRHNATGLPTYTIRLVVLAASDSGSLYVGSDNRTIGLSVARQIGILGA
jgi:hypothetical protein